MRRYSGQYILNVGCLVEVEVNNVVDEMERIGQRISESSREGGAVSASSENYLLFWSLTLAPDSIQL